MREPQTDHNIEHQGLKSDPMLVLLYSRLTVDDVVENAANATGKLKG